MASAAAGVLRSSGAGVLRSAGEVWRGAVRRASPLRRDVSERRADQRGQRDGRCEVPISTVAGARSQPVKLAP